MFCRCVHLKYLLPADILNKLPGFFFNTMHTSYLPTPQSKSFESKKHLLCTLRLQHGRKLLGGPLIPKKSPDCSPTNVNRCLDQPGWRINEQRNYIVLDGPGTGIIREITATILFNLIRNLISDLKINTL